jgi:acetylcholinesterase
MRLHIYLGLIGATVTLGHSSPTAFPASNLQVKTDSGILFGFVNSSAPNVRQFLGVPFAHSPEGSRRWQPPTRLQSNAPVNATSFGPACPQIGINDQTLVDVFSPSGGNETEYFPLAIFGEDCLTLDIWAPRSQKKDLPVFVWFYGGGFVQGGTNSLYFNPQSWIERTQEHIVVAVNFRSNIFGFPNADGLDEQNLGLLDQRMGLEWVRNNIASFGGDPSKIVAWGQSGGAIAVDFLNFAYPSDPIVSGMILDSSTALYPHQASQTADIARANFTAVAQALNCSSTASQLDCMRSKSWQDIEAVLQADTTLQFLTVVDNNLVFSNYTQRYSTGAISPVPAIIGTNQHEFNAFLSPSYNQTSADAKTDLVFLCTAAHSSQLRQNNSLVTYRYRYDGNFTDLSPPGYPGAGHASELPLIFGTQGLYHGPSSPYEDEVSNRIQDLWLEFAKNSKDGLSEVGWGSYGDGKAVLIGGASTPVQEINISELDGVCNSLPAFA